MHVYMYAYMYLQSTIHIVVTSKLGDYVMVVESSQIFLGFIYSSLLLECYQIMDYKNILGI